MQCLPQYFPCLGIYGSALFRFEKTFSKELICINNHLYTNCAAYSCGIGDGGLLFYVLAGVTVLGPVALEALIC